MNMASASILTRLQRLAAAPLILSVLGAASASAQRMTASHAVQSSLRLSALPAQSRVAANEETSVTLAVQAGVTFQSKANLRVRDVPANVQAWCYPPQLSPAGSTLFVHAGKQAVPGVYALRVEATKNGVSRFVPVSLTVLPVGASTQDKPYPLNAAFSASRPAPLPSSGTLLNNIGLLSQPVPPAAFARWNQTLKTGTAAPRQAAQLHLWIGEYLLARDQQPEQARRHFGAVKQLVPQKHDLAGLAAYDNAIALYYEGAYLAATNEFQSLLANQATARGFDHKTCTLWLRMAVACWGYHAERVKLGIPEPPRLDPLCAASALATCTRALHEPFDKKTILRNCRVTGEGSLMADLLAGARSMGLSPHLLSCDEQGLQNLPKPLVAYVEHDHYIAVVDTNADGVTYLCSDCGAWPGGQVHLTWKQWRALEASQFVVIRHPGDAWDVALQDEDAGRTASTRASGLRLAAYPAPDPLAKAAGRARLLLRGHFKFKIDPPNNGPCGTPPTSPANPPAGNPPADSPGDNGDDNGPSDDGDDWDDPDDWDDSNDGPSCGDPVELPTSEERYGRIGRLTVYNPHGPAIHWHSSYRSLRGPGQFFASTAPGGTYDATYEDYDFGVGWTQPYNMGIYDPTAGGTGTKYVFYSNGTRVSFTVSAKPTASNPSVRCSVQAGKALLVEWDYSAAIPGGYYVITTPKRNRLVTTGYNADVRCHLLSRVINRNGNGLNFVYGWPIHAHGWPLLSQITDDNNNALLTVTRAHDTTGNITRVSDVYGRSLYYHCGYYPATYTPKPYPQGYQEIDHISQIVPTGTAGASDRYAYGYQGVSNSEGELIPFLHTITVPSPTGTGTTTATINYGSYSLVAGLVDANGNKRVYTSSDANGNAVYPSSYTKITVTNSGGLTTSSYIVGYGSSMLETSRRNGAGQLTYSAVYADANDPYKPSTVTDANNNVTHLTYDQFGNMLTATSPRGTVTTNTFDYTQFGLGELKTSQEGGKAPTRLTYYEPSGLVSAISMPAPGSVNGGSVVTSTWTYDNQGDVLSITTPGNSAAPFLTTTLNYTSDGAYSQPLPARRLPLTATDNLGHVTHFRYDNQGNRTAVIDALGNETDFAYNIANQVIGMMYPATGQNGAGHAYAQNVYQYPGGQLNSTQAFDESGAQIRQVNYLYGLEGEALTSVAVGPNGSTPLMTRAYDAQYRLKTVSDGSGHATTYTYNTAGYLARVSYPNSSGTFDTIQFPQYDALGNLLQRVDGRGLVTNYHYADPQNALTDIQYPASPALNVHIDYDAYGRRADMTDATGNAVYSYDDGNRLLSAATTYTGLPTQTVSYGYFPNGSRESLNTPGGSFAYSYDGASRLTSLTNPFGETSQWTYQANNWLAAQTLANGIVTTYAYNGRGQLTDLLNRIGGISIQAEPGNSLSHFGSLTYDGVGNLTSLTAAIPQAPNFGGQTSYAYDYKDQLVQEQSSRSGGYNNAFAYDAAGNPTTFRNANVTYNADNQNTANGYDGEGNPTTYKGAALAFDPENRLTAYGSVMSAGYDGMGRRAWKQNANGRAYFLYDGMNPVCELDATGAVAAVNTFGANGLLSRANLGVSALVVPGSSRSVFYTFDTQGGVAQRLDAGGNVLNTNVLDAFGSISSTIGTADPYNGYGAQWGYRNDPETGLQLLGYRYYDAATGHFLTRDPIRYSGGINLYGYVGSSPTYYHDPFGLDATTAANTFRWFFRMGVAEEVIGGGPEDPVADIAFIGTLALGSGYALYEWLQPSIPTFCNSSLPLKGKPNSTGVRDSGNGKGQIRDYGSDGYPATDYDFGHDHTGAGDPHAHDWGRPSDGTPPTNDDRGAPRPIGPNETAPK